MPSYDVADAGALAPGNGMVVLAGDTALALFNVGGEFFALDNTCLHRGGPVGLGDLEDTTVTCPWHGWQYDVTTGEHLFDRSIGLVRYLVRVEDGRILVETP